MKLELVERDGYYGIRKKVWGVFNSYWSIYDRAWRLFTPHVRYSYYEVQREMKLLHSGSSRKIKVVSKHD
jgi:hypothetical protein